MRFFFANNALVHNARGDLEFRFVTLRFVKRLTQIHDFNVTVLCILGPSYSLFGRSRGIIERCCQKRDVRLQTKLHGPDTGPLNEGFNYFVMI